MNIEPTSDQFHQNSASQVQPYISPDISLFTPNFADLLVKLAPVFLTHHLPLILSKDNALYVQDLTQTPNVLIAGTIGSGKTQLIYNQLAAWFFHKKPEELKVIICAGKSVDYDCFSKLTNHFLASGVVGDPIGTPPEFLTIINGVLHELELRSQMLAAARVRNISQYNNLVIEAHPAVGPGHKFLPDMVMVIDDLFSFLVNDEIVNRLVLLTQKFTHCGVFVIAATTQINSKLISKYLKTNFTFRIALKLMSQSDSRKILDSEGAEKLNSQGEIMYYLNGRLLKTQQPYIEYQDLLNVIEHIANQPRDTQSLFLEDSVSEIAAFDLTDRDQFFEEAARLIVMHQQGSTSLIQRKLKLNYNRAGRIIDQLEAAGVVGPFEGSKAREVLIPDEYSLERFLGTLDQAGSQDVKTYKPAVQKETIPTLETVILPTPKPYPVIDSVGKEKLGLMNSFKKLFR